MLPLEAKETKFANKPKDEPEAVPRGTISGLEELRQQKGKVVEPSDEDVDDSTFALKYFCLNIIL